MIKRRHHQVQQHIAAGSSNILKTATLKAVIPIAKIAAAHQTTMAEDTTTNTNNISSSRMQIFHQTR
jgi:hypothetical protein